MTADPIGLAGVAHALADHLRFLQALGVHSRIEAVALAHRGA